MNDFLKKTLPRNPNTTLTREQTEEKYFTDAYLGSIAKPNKNVFIYSYDGNRMPLYCASVRQAEFICGIWRFQNSICVQEFNHITIRNKEFIVHEQLPDTTDGFAYYSATKLPLQYTCYGPTSMRPDRILANLHTHWSYGKNIEDASAWLSRRLAKTYRDVIDAAIEQEKQR